MARVRTFLAAVLAIAVLAAALPGLAAGAPTDGRGLADEATTPAPLAAEEKDVEDPDDGDHPCDDFWERVGQMNTSNLSIDCPHVIYGTVASPDVTRFITVIEHLERLPVDGMRAEFLADERINVYVDDSAIGVVTGDDVRIEQVHRGALDDATVRIELDEETAREVANARDPGTEIRRQVERGDVNVHGVGPVNALTYDAARVGLDLYDMGRDLASGVENEIDAVVSFVSRLG